MKEEFDKVVAEWREKVKAPEGYMRLEGGTVREGDLTYGYDKKEFFPVDTREIGKPVHHFLVIARKVS